jgi:hypothetical protein
MDADLLFRDFLRLFFIVTSPITFLVGVFLIMDVENYLKLEKLLGKSYGSRKTFMEQLEKNRQSLQNFLLRWRHYVGIICVLNSAAAVFIIIHLLKR